MISLSILPQRVVVQGTIDGSNNSYVKAHPTTTSERPFFFAEYKKTGIEETSEVFENLISNSKVKE